MKLKSANAAENETPTGRNKFTPLKNSGSFIGTNGASDRNSIISNIVISTT
ncbi:MAG: hypothetical protein QXI16_06965 [Sulfolobaceae archaeon]